jgi:Spy/CpxP family protein refolding chaperone
MRRRITLISIIIALAALAAVPFLYADRSPMGRGHGFGFFGHFRALKSELNLTDDQVTQIKGIAKDLRAQNETYRTQLRGGYLGIAQALIANPNDLSAARALMNQQPAAEQAMKTNALTAASKALNVLSADQRAKLADFLASHQNEFLKGHKGPRG